MQIAAIGDRLGKSINLGSDLIGVVQHLLVEGIESGQILLIDLDGREEARIAHRRILDFADETHHQIIGSPHLFGVLHRQNDVAADRPKSGAIIKPNLLQTAGDCVAQQLVGFPSLAALHVASEAGELAEQILQCAGVPHYLFVKPFYFVDHFLIALLHQHVWLRRMFDSSRKTSDTLYPKSSLGCKPICRLLACQGRKYSVPQKGQRITPLPANSSWPLQLLQRSRVRNSLASLE